MDFFRIIYYTLITIGVIIGFIRRKKLNRSSHRFWLLLLVTLSVELLAFTLKDYRIAIYHISTISFWLFYLWAFSDDLKLNVLLPWLVLIPCVLAMINAVFFESFFTAFPSHSYVIISLCTIVLVLFYFFKIIQSSKVIKLHQLPLFWIASGLLLFYTVNLFGFGAVRIMYVSENKQLLNLFKYLRIFSNYILYSTFIIAFLIKQMSLEDE